MDRKIEIYANIARQWNAAGLVYAVGHGVEQYPSRAGRDIDVYLPRIQVPLAAKIARDVLVQYGFTTCIPQKDAWGKVSVYGFRYNYIEDIEIDLAFQGFAWGPLQVIRRICSSHNIGPFKVDPWISFVKRVVTRALLGDPPKDIWMFPWEEHVARDECTKIFGAELTEALLNALKEKDSAEIAELAPSLRRTLVVRAFLRQPLSAISGSFRWVIREVRPYLVSTAPVVAVLGPDEIDRSKILQRIRFENSFLFRPVIRRYGPNVLPQIGDFRFGTGRDVSRLAGARIQNWIGKLRHWLRLTYVSLDFLLNRFRDNWVTNTNRAVIYDGYLLDAYVEPPRFGFSSNVGIRTLWRRWLKPDLSIVLVETPEQVQTRNPEVDTEALSRQIEEWKRLREMGDVDVLLEVNAPPEEIARRIERLIKESFVRKHAPEKGNQREV